MVPPENSVWFNGDAPLDLTMWYIVSALHKYKLGRHYLCTSPMRKVSISPFRTFTTSDMSMDLM